MRLCARIATVACIALLPGPSAAAASRPPPRHRRHPRAAAPRTVTLQWVGDIALSSQRGLPPGGPDAAFEPVARVLHRADLSAGNLEGTLLSGGASKCGGIGGGTCFAFQAPPSTARALRRAGFGLVNQANNHSMDYGASGRMHTLAALQAARVAVTGLPGQITLLRVAGQRVAFLGFAPYDYDGNLLDVPGAVALVRRARRHARLVVVIIHAGAEGAGELHTPYGHEFFLGEDRGDARAFAHAVIAAGACLVLGSGPHVVRGIERYRGRLIAYSLGNFVGYHTLGGGGVLSLSGILRVTVDSAGRLLRGRWISVRLDGGLPHQDRQDTSAHLVASLSRSDFASTFRFDGAGSFGPPPLRLRA
jgi:hypothetical protein